jgi:amino acid transporter
MEADPASTPGLKRSLSVWAAAGRAVPLTFLIAAVGVLLVAYSFVRLCQPSSSWRCRP